MPGRPGIERAGRAGRVRRTGREAEEAAELPRPPSGSSRQPEQPDRGGSYRSRAGTGARPAAGVAGGGLAVRRGQRARPRAGQLRPADTPSSTRTLAYARGTAQQGGWQQPQRPACGTAAERPGVGPQRDGVNAVTPHSRADGGRWPGYSRISTRVAGADDGVRARVVGDEVDAEPDLAVPAAVAGQGGNRLVALGGGVGVDRGHDAAVAALDGPERDRADAQAAPAVLGPRRGAGYAQRWDGTGAWGPGPRPPWGPRAIQSFSAARDSSVVSSSG